MQIEEMMPQIQRAPREVPLSMTTEPRNPVKIIAQAAAMPIVRAVRAARPGDVVVVAGKGHETGQERNGVKHPFDDVDEEARALFEAAIARRPVLTRISEAKRLRDTAEAAARRAGAGRVDAELVATVIGA